VESRSPDTPFGDRALVHADLILGPAALPPDRLCLTPSRADRQRHEQGKLATYAGHSASSFPTGLARGGTPAGGTHPVCCQILSRLAHRGTRRRSGDHLAAKHPAYISSPALPIGPAAPREESR